MRRAFAGLAVVLAVLAVVATVMLGLLLKDGLQELLGERHVGELSTGC